MNVPNPVGTRKPCPRGCGADTVIALDVTGPVRVHCGTRSTRCHTRGAR